MKARNCPKCQSSMTEGFMIDATYGANMASRWVEGPPEKAFFGGVKFRGKTVFDVQTWRCQRCGLLESYAVG
jgi:Domain of unknown function (DUF6487)